jgi:hypothetical protein
LAAEIARQAKDYRRNNHVNREDGERESIMGSGELLKLGIEVSKRTIQRYMPKDRNEHSSSQNRNVFGCL